MFAVEDGGRPLTFRRSQAPPGRGGPEPAGGSGALDEGDGERFRAWKYGGSAWTACGARERSSVRAQLKARIKEAERAGNLGEALRLALELQELERAAGAARG